MVGILPILFTRKLVEEFHTAGVKFIVGSKVLFVVSRGERGEEGNSNFKTKPTETLTKEIPSALYTTQIKMKWWH